MKLFLTQKSLDRYVAQQANETVNAMVARGRPTQAIRNKMMSLLLDETVQLKIRLGETPAQDIERQSAFGYSSTFSQSGVNYGLL